MGNAGATCCFKLENVLWIRALTMNEFTLGHQPLLGSVIAQLLSKVAAAVIPPPKYPAYHCTEVGLESGLQLCFPRAVPCDPTMPPVTSA